MEQIQIQISANEKELVELPPPVFTVQEKALRFENCLGQYIKYIKCSIKGNLDGRTVKKNLTNQVRGYLEQDAINFQIRRQNFFSSEFHECLKIKINESRDFNLANFINTKVFQTLICDQINENTKNIEDILNIVVNFVLSVLIELAEKPFEAYPQLKKSIQLELKKVMEEQRRSVFGFMKTILDIEKQLTFTSNAYYMDMFVKISAKIEERKKTQNLNKNLNKPDANQSLFVSTRDNGQMKSQFSMPNFEESFVEINDCKILESEIYSRKILESQSDLDMAVVNLQIACFAYWKVIEKRFLDYYHNKLVIELVFYFRDKLRAHLHELFSPILSEIGRGLICEKKDITTRRAALKTSSERLRKAEEQLRMII